MDIQYAKCFTTKNFFFCQIYSEEKAKLLRNAMEKIDSRNETLE